MAEPSSLLGPGLNENVKNLTLSEGLISTQASVCTYLPSIMMWISEGSLYSELSLQVVAVVCFQSHCIANCFPNLIFEEFVVLDPDPIRLFSCSTECLCSTFIVFLFFGTFHLFVDVISKKRV